VITKDLPTGYENIPHPSLPPEPTVNLSELIQKEVDRVGAGEPRKGGVNLSRYEAPDEPARDSDVESWRQALRSAYISSTYLAGRHTNLSLLEEFGKNAWLIGNSQLEEILKDLEKELTRLKEETDTVNKARKTAQTASKGEVVGLGETWKRGIGKILEVQVATDSLRQEILERRRTGAS